MDKYIIQKIDHPEYGYIVFSNSYESPLDELEKIKKFLINENYSGKVVFNFLLNTAVKNSIVEIPFNNFDFSLRDNKNVSFDELISEISRIFYRDNFDKVDTSILSKPIKFKLKNGITL